MKIVFASVSGALFAFGLVFSGMTDPAKVQAFLDFGGIASGRWDPSLAFVMGGALAVTIPGFAWLRSREHTRVPPSNETTTNHIDAQLILGTMLFGIGWGLSGYCPGPAIASGINGGISIAVFLAAMAIGMIAAKFALRRKQA
jgi:uncharacterized protein